ncbi:hypothetical protein G5C66_20655 [Nocardioides sp. KC13]|uniref:HTH luxR-type domain-containing protein n=1 Tax=Nocardioides turkmenicus TaxID=2711220 RepID=A0A6M1RFS8_9ACTN|nr:LuxR C-terminal-related transcriptional regulator [Nocardioides sp. KC13]NGN95137.1 hypothetical protein [Nocardioides sp. KC13]
MLETLGFNSTEAAVYELLVSRGRLALEDLLAPGPAAQRRQAVAALEAKGLVRRLAGAAQEYVVAPPEEAVEVLIAEQMRALQSVRVQAAEVAARVWRVAQRADPTELVEVVTGEDASQHLFRQVVRTARQELAVFDRPPYAMKIEEAEAREITSKQAERMKTDGLVLRTVFDRSLLDDPSQVRRILAGAAAGEQSRIASVPLKLVIVDREWGLLPLVHTDGVTPGAAVIVRSSVLLDSLLALFESIWEHAAEVKPHVDDPSSLGDTEAGLRRLAQLLATGMTDVAIAHHLAISERTVRRRIKELMSVLHVDSRFQAGVRAAEKGWL